LIANIALLTGISLLTPSDEPERVRRFTEESGVH